MTKVALIDKAPNKTDYVMHFNNEFEFDHYHLCSEQKKKILKRDVDIDIDLDAYDWIILVGSEALQNFTREKSITCLLYTSPSPRDTERSRMPSSA